VTFIFLGVHKFLEIQEIAWRMMNSRHATHPFLHDFGVLEGESPDNMALATRRRLSATLFLGCA